MCFQFSIVASGPISYAGQASILFFFVLPAPSRPFPSLPVCPYLLCTLPCPPEYLILFALYTTCTPFFRPSHDACGTNHPNTSLCLHYLVPVPLFVVLPTTLVASITPKPRFVCFVPVPPFCRPSHDACGIKHERRPYDTYIHTTGPGPGRDHPALDRPEEHATIPP